MTFTVATHNTAKGTADFDDFADIVVRQEMWSWSARRRLRKADGDDRRSWWPRPHFGTTITSPRDWEPGRGGSWRAHRGVVRITPARGPVMRTLTAPGGTRVAVFGVHYINGARHNRFKFPGTLAMRVRRWDRFHAKLIEQVAKVRRDPGTFVVIAGDFNADDHLMPDVPGFKRVGHRIDWILYDDRLALTDFDRLGSHGSDHPVLRAAFRTPDETPEVPMNRFVTKEQWGHNPSKEATEDSHPIGATQGITAHWEGARVGTEPHSACAQRVRNIERSHEYGRGWGDIAYNLLVCQHGYVFEGRGAGVRSAANGYTAANDSHYAVCALMGPGDAFTDEFHVGFLFAFDHLERHGNAGPERNGHRDHKATQCPGDDIYRWVSNLPPGAGARPTTEEEFDMAGISKQEFVEWVAEGVSEALRRVQTNDQTLNANIRDGSFLSAKELDIIASAVARKLKEN